MMKCKMCVGHKVSFALVFVGALNWGLVGLFQFNLVSYLFGSMPTLERVIYVLVGLAAIMMLFACKCKKCMEGGCCGGKEGEGSCCGCGEKKM